MQHSQRGAVRTDLLLASVLTAAVLGLGVYLGSSLFGERPPGSAQPAEAPRSSSPREAVPPTLQGSPISRDIDSRLAAVEKALGELRTSQAATTEQIQPIVQEYERLKREGPMVLGEPSALGPPEFSEHDMAADGARKVATSLGLDASRREAMATQLAQTLTEIKKLEKAHAEVSRDGAVMTIKIGKFGVDGERALQPWRDWIDRNLTQQEKDAYDRDHGESKLLGVRAGLFDRTVRIDESTGAIKVTESIATKDGAQQVLQMEGPAQARDLVLKPYSHLMPTSER